MRGSTSLVTLESTRASEDTRQASDVRLDQAAQDRDTEAGPSIVVSVNRTVDRSKTKRQKDAGAIDADTNGEKATDERVSVSWQKSRETNR